MGSLFEELAAREAVAGARVEELQAQIVELTGRLEVERERWSRLVVTRETLAELAAQPSVGLFGAAVPVVAPSGSSSPPSLSGPSSGLCL